MTPKDTKPSLLCLKSYYSANLKKSVYISNANLCIPSRDSSHPSCKSRQVLPMQKKMQGSAFTISLATTEVLF